MAVFKCKMCGGSLDVQENMTVIECDFCGTKQTLPNTNDEALQTLFNRANTLRMKSEFDKAAELYEKIVEQDDTQAEAHWGIVLCKYGIEYVEDPKTRKRIPTCHRASFEAVTKDIDYQAAIKHADTHQKYIYEAEAKAIDTIQRDILKIVNEEEPFDVFICYKETDSNGKRTVDSTIANDIYYQLTEQGYKVFYAAITLEDKLGQEYEPYIFAALNSAKVMLSIGTKPEYFQAVWVKNEWSRFLKIMKNDRSRMLIPCYRDMDAYELPEEFAHLQAQDMAKIGFISDLLRGIGKIIKKDEPKTVIKETVIQQKTEAPAQDVSTLLKRAYILLEDGARRDADSYADKVLDIDPENAEAYLCKLISNCNQRKKEQLVHAYDPLDEDPNYHRALRYGDEKLKKTLQEYNAAILYRIAKGKLENAKTKEAYLEVAKLFADERVVNYKDSKELNKKCIQLAADVNKENAYQKALTYLRDKDYDNAKKIFESISSYKDSHQKYQSIVYIEAKKYENSSIPALVQLSIDRFKTIRGYSDVDKRIAALEAKMPELQKKHEAEQKKEKRKKTLIGVIIAMVALLIVAIVLFFTVINPAMKKNAFIEKYGQEIYDKYGYVAKKKIVTFGNYEQDNNMENGKEPITWKVLEVQEDRALLISKYIIDEQNYGTDGDYEWYNCGLREWLNGEFFDTAFTAEEQASILTTTVTTSKEEGKPTEDKVYILSREELEKYTTFDLQRVADSTKYNRYKNGGSDEYYLREPNNLDGVEIVNFEGGFSTDRYPDGYGVRPVIWISLK